jgi:hypothetical protein
VDAHGFAVDDLEAALKASMTETKGRPPSPFDAASDGVGASASPASALARSGSAAGLRNLEGEYNCFLNVVIQSLWHVSAFRDAMRRWEPSARAKKQDTDVARALRDVFRALDAARDAARDADGEARPAAEAGPGPAAPTALREALSALLDGEGALFAEREMADASEALQAIFHAVHRACAPDTPGAASRGVWRNRNAPQNTSSRGAFLDEESRYRSLAHDIFGLDVDESVACGSCGAKTHALRYTKFLHLLPVAALNDACRGLTEKKAGAFAGGAEGAKDEKKNAKNATRFSRAIRAVDARDEKSCDADAGGCGRRQPLTHAVVRANGTPETFCVALTWETANADAATVRETVANVDERVSLRLAFGDAAAGPNAAASAANDGGGARVVCAEVRALLLRRALLRVRDRGDRDGIEREKREKGVDAVRRRHHQARRRVGGRARVVREGEAAAVRAVLPKNAPERGLSDVFQPRLSRGMKKERGLVRVQNVRKRVLYT